MKLGSPRRLKTIFRTNLRVSAAAARWQRIQDHRRPPSGRSARGLNHASRDLLAIPVVDAANQLVGVVTVDDVIDVIRDEATEDILKLAGTTAEEIHFPGVLRGAWIRFPWLGASFIGGFLGIYLLARFEGLLSQTLQIAFFLPIVLAMGGNIGSQCSMVDRFAPNSPHRQPVGPISTGTRRGRVFPRRWPRNLHTELPVRRGQVFSLVSGALPESGATRDAREARKEPHFRVRSRLSISGGSGCADGFPVGVPFALQWPPMAVWVHHIHCFRRGEEPSHKTTDDGVIGRMEI